MRNFLTAQQVIVLREAHYDSKFRKQADRIKAILALNRGLSYEQTAKLLLLDQTTIRRYEKEFKKIGVDGILENNHIGSDPYLTVNQQHELTLHLKENTYQKVLEIVVYVKNTYNKIYSIEGMTHLLHRLGFVYKKTKAIPGKVDRNKQEVFKKEYLKLKQGKNLSDKIYFVDAAHPQHNNQPFYGWIYKGEEKAIKTNSGRKRVNRNN